MDARCLSQSSLFPSFIPSILPSSSHPSFHPSFHPSILPLVHPPLLRHLFFQPSQPAPRWRPSSRMGQKESVGGDAWGWAPGWRSGLSRWQPATSTALPMALPSTGQGKVSECLHGVHTGELCSRNRVAGGGSPKGQRNYMLSPVQNSCV